MLVEADDSRSVSRLLNLEPVADFQTRKPFPWVSYQNFMPASMYQELKKDFPGLPVFVRQENEYRGLQRPHNRLYLTLTEGPVEPGKILYASLPVTWRRVVSFFQSGSYSEFVYRLTGVSPTKVRFAWHRSHRESEVSPHTDVPKKLCTQIFYFNDSSDWNRHWGGNTLLLDGCPVDLDSPDFHQFERDTSVDMLSTQCLLFQRTEQSWHGMKSLTCPEHVYRNTFNVISELG